MSNPWGFFDGASQNDGSLSGVGYILLGSTAHCHTGKVSFDHGSNNYGEFEALLLLIKIALNKGYTTLQVYGNSEFTIR